MTLRHPRVMPDACRQAQTSSSRPFHSVGNSCHVVVAATCVVRVDLHGAALETPEVWAFVRFAGFEGGFVHRLLVPAERARAGLAVRAVLRPLDSRTGAITDIAGFAPVSP